MRNNYRELVQILNDVHNKDTSDEGTSSVTMFDLVKDIVEEKKAEFNFLNKLYQSLDSLFVIDQRIDEIISTYHNKGRVFFPHGWAASRKFNHATYIELIKSDDCCSMRLYNIGAGSHHNSSLSERNSQLRQKLAPYLSFHKKLKFRDNDKFKTFLNHLMCISQPSFKLVNISPKSYMKWIESCILEFKSETSFSLEEKTDDHEAVYRATQFSGSCTWKSLSSTFCQFLPNDWKKSISIIKISALSRLITYKNSLKSDDLALKRVSQALELAKMGVSQRILKSNDDDGLKEKLNDVLQKSPINTQQHAFCKLLPADTDDAFDMIEDVSINGKTPDISLAPISHDQSALIANMDVFSLYHQLFIYDRFEIYRNRLFYTLTKKIRDAFKEVRLLMTENEPQIQATAVAAKLKELFDNHHTLSFKEQALEIYKLLYPQPKNLTKEPKARNSFLLLWAKDIITEREAGQENKTCQDLDDEMKIFYRILKETIDITELPEDIRLQERILNQSKPRQSDNHLDRIVLLQVLTLFKILRLVNTAPLIDNHEQNRETSIELCNKFLLHLLYRFFSKPLHSSCNFAHTQYALPILTEIQNDLMAILKPFEHYDRSAVFIGIEPVNQWGEQYRQIETLKKYRRDRIEHVDNMFFDPINMYLSKFEREKEVIEWNFHDPLKPELDPRNLIEISEVWQDIHSPLNESLDSKSALCMINRDDHNAENKASQELRYAVSDGINGDMTKLAAYIQHTCGPHLNSVWGPNTSTADLFKRQRYILMHLLRKLHSQPLNQDSCIELARSIVHAIRQLLRHDRYEHTCYLLHAMSLLCDTVSTRETGDAFRTKLLQISRGILASCYEKSQETQLSVPQDFYKLCATLNAKCLIELQSEFDHELISNYIIFMIFENYAVRSKINYCDYATTKYVNSTKEFIWIELKHVFSEPFILNPQDDSYNKLCETLQVPHDFSLKKLHYLNNQIIFNFIKNDESKNVKINSLGDVTSPFRTNISLSQNLQDHPTFQKLFPDQSLIGEEITLIDNQIEFNYGANRFSAKQINSAYYFYYHQSIEGQDCQFRYVDQTPKHQIFYGKSIWHVENTTDKRVIMLTLDTAGEQPISQIQKLNNNEDLMIYIPQSDDYQQLEFVDDEHVLSPIAKPHQTYIAWHEHSPQSGESKHELTASKTYHACHLDLSFTKIDNVLVCNEILNHRIIKHHKIKTWFDEKLSYKNYLILRNENQIRIVIPKVLSENNEAYKRSRYKLKKPNISEMHPSEEVNYYLYEWKNNTLESANLDAQWFLVYLLINYDANGLGSEYAAEYTRSKIISADNSTQGHLSEFTIKALKSLNKKINNPFRIAVMASRVAPKQIRDKYIKMLSSVMRNVPIAYRSKLPEEPYSYHQSVTQLKVETENVRIIFPLEFVSQPVSSDHHPQEIDYIPGAASQEAPDLAAALVLLNNNNSFNVKLSFSQASSPIERARHYIGNMYHQRGGPVYPERIAIPKITYTQADNVISTPPYIKPDPFIQVYTITAQRDISESKTSASIIEHEMTYVPIGEKIKTRLTQLAHKKRVNPQSHQNDDIQCEQKSNAQTIPQDTEEWLNVALSELEGIYSQDEFSVHLYSKNYITPQNGMIFFQSLIADFEDVGTVLGIKDIESFNNIKTLAKRVLWYSTNLQNGETERQFDFNHPHAYILLLLEYRLNIRLRPSQMEMVNYICQLDSDNESFVKRIIQANMGDGKTTIAGTLSLILAKLRPHQLSILELPLRIIKQQGPDVIKQCKHIYNVEFTMATFDRKDAQSIDKIDSLLIKLTSAIEHKTPIITTAESISCVRLSILEHILQRPPEQIKVTKLIKIYNLFLQGSKITDEFDDVYGAGAPVRYSLNADNQFLDAQLIQNIVPIIKSYVQACRQLKIDYQNKVSEDIYQKQILKQLFEVMAQHENFPWNDFPPLTKLQKIFTSKIKHKEKAKNDYKHLETLLKSAHTKPQEIIDYIHSVCNQAHITECNDEEKKRIIDSSLIIHYFVHVNLSPAIAMPAGLVYGLEQDKVSSRIIIPFKGGKPCIGSKFSDVLTTATLTTLQALRDGFTYSEFVELIKSHIQDCQDFMKNCLDNSPGGELIKIIDPEYFGSFFNNIHHISEYEIDERIKSLYGSVKKSPEHNEKVLWYMIEKNILPKISFHQQQLKAPWAGAPKGSGFSGTTHFTARFINHSCPTDKGIDGQTIFNLMEMDSKFYSEELLNIDNLQQYIKHNPSLRAVIDAGSLIQTPTMLEYIHKIKDTIFKTGCQAIFYFEDDNFFALKQNAKAPISLDSFEENSIKSHVGVDIDQRFWFYGPGQTRGVDAKLKADCKVLVLGREECSLADWLQAAMRARGLGKGQTCDFVLEHNLIANYELIAEPDSQKLCQKDNSAFNVELWWQKCIDTDTELDSHKMFSDAIDAIESIYQNKLFEKITQNITENSTCEITNWQRIQEIITTFFVNHATQPKDQIRNRKKLINSIKELEKFNKNLQNQYKNVIDVKSLQNQVSHVINKMGEHVADETYIVGDIRKTHGQNSPVKVQEQQLERSQEQTQEMTRFVGNSFIPAQNYFNLSPQGLDTLGLPDMSHIMMASFNYVHVAERMISLHTLHRATHVLLTNQRVSHKDYPEYPFILMTADDAQYYESDKLTLPQAIIKASPRIINLNHIDIKLTQLPQSNDKQLMLDRTKAMIMTMLISGNLDWIHQVDKLPDCQDGTSAQYVLSKYFKHTHCQETKNFVKRVIQAHPHIERQLKSIFKSNFVKYHQSAKVIQFAWKDKHKIKGFIKRRKQHQITSGEKIKQFITHAHKSKIKREQLLGKIRNELSQSNHQVNRTIKQITSVNKMLPYLWLFAAVLALANLVFNISILPKAMFVASMLSGLMTAMDVLLQYKLKSYIKKTENCFTHRSNCMNKHTFRYLNNSNLKKSSRVSPLLFLMKSVKVLSAIAFFFLALVHLISPINPMLLLITPVLTLISNHLEQRLTKQQYHNWTKHFQKNLHRKYQSNPSESYNKLLKSAFPYMYSFRALKSDNPKQRKTMTDLIFSIKESIAKLPDDNIAKAKILDDLASMITNGEPIGKFGYKNDGSLANQEQLLNLLTTFLISANVSQDKQYTWLFTLLRFAKTNHLNFDPVTHTKLSQRFPVTGVVKQYTSGVILRHLKKKENDTITAEDIKNILRQRHLNDEGLFIACTEYAKAAHLSIDIEASEYSLFEHAVKKCIHFYEKTHSRTAAINQTLKQFGSMIFKQFNTHITSLWSTLHSMTQNKTNRTLRELDFYQKTISKKQKVISLSTQNDVENFYAQQIQAYRPSSKQIRFTSDPSFSEGISKLRSKRYQKLHTQSLYQQLRLGFNQISVAKHYNILCQNANPQDQLTNLPSNQSAACNQANQDTYAIRVSLSEFLAIPHLKHLVCKKFIAKDILVVDSLIGEQKTDIDTSTLSLADFNQAKESAHTTTLDNQQTNDDEPQSSSVIITRETLMKITLEQVRSLSLTKHSDPTSPATRLIATVGPYENIHLSTKEGADLAIGEYDFTLYKPIVEINFLKKLKKKVSDKIISKEQVTQISQAISSWRQETPGSQLVNDRMIASCPIDQYINELISIDKLRSTLSISNEKLSLSTQNGSQILMIHEDFPTTIVCERAKQILQPCHEDILLDDKIDLKKIKSCFEDNQSTLLIFLDREIEIWNSIHHLKEQLIYSSKPIAQIIENGVCNSQCDFEKQASPDGKQNPITFSI